MMIGVTMLAEGFSFHLSKGYIYFSIAFAFLVDVIQLKTVKKLHTTDDPELNEG
jgi:predicted tellurium resistance membrane protein TerC